MRSWPRYNRAAPASQASRPHIMSAPTRSRRMRPFAVLLILAAPLVAQEPLPTSHTVRDIEGWTVHVDDRLLKADEPTGVPALRILANRLYDIKLAVPADKVARLQKVPIWLDLTHGKLRPAQYHPSAGWLKSNGYSAELARCVHIPRADDFIAPSHQNSQPWSVMHELAHAYHDQVLGFDEAKVKAVYERFKTKEQYKTTLHVSGRKIEHYALTN